MSSYGHILISSNIFITFDVNQRNITHNACILKVIIGNYIVVSWMRSCVEHLPSK